MKKTRKQIRKERQWKHWLYWLGDGPFFDSNLKEIQGYDPEKYRQAFHKFQTHGVSKLTVEEQDGIKPLVDAQKCKEIFLTSLALESLEWWSCGHGWIHPWRHTVQINKTDPKKMDRITLVAIARTIRKIREDSYGFFARHPGIREDVKARFLAIRLSIS